MKIHEKAMSLLVIFSSVFIATLAVNGDVIYGLMFITCDYLTFSALTDMGTPIHCKS